MEGDRGMEKHQRLFQGALMSCAPSECHHMSMLPTCSSACEDSEDAYESVGFLSGKRLLASVGRSCGAHYRRVGGSEGYRKSDEGGVRVAGGHKQHSWPRAQADLWLMVIFH